MTYHCYPVNFNPEKAARHKLRRHPRSPRHELQAISDTRYKHIHVRSNTAPTTMDGGSAGFAGAKTCHAAYDLRVNGAAMMTYDAFNKLCRSLPAVSYVIQWGDSHVWKVGGKVFAIGGWQHADKPAFTFKTSESDFLFLSDEPGYRPAPYFASRGMIWIQQYDAPDTEDDELIYYLKESHRIVSLGLTRKKQKELGLNRDITT